jgi:hypothetical protein
MADDKKYIAIVNPGALDRMAGDRLPCDRHSHLVGTTDAFLSDGGLLITWDDGYFDQSQRRDVKPVASA